MLNILFAIQIESFEWRLNAELSVFAFLVGLLRFYLICLLVDGAPNVCLQNHKRKKPRKSFCISINVPRMMVLLLMLLALLLVVLLLCMRW